MGNLIGLKESFAWEENLIDRNNFIDNLNLAIVEARNYGDAIFGPPDFYDIKLSWGDFVLFLYQTQFDDQARLIRFPWLTQMQHTTLIQIFNFFQATTPLQATSLVDLHNEFIHENNGNIGCYYDDIPNEFVHDIITWNTFHKIFVSTFTYQQRCDHFEYFDRFYVHGLTMPANQIQTLINQGNVNPTITLIHQPLVPHEQLHIHFDANANCALNIDGTWKHEVPGFRIPVQVCELLSDWGFRLPIQYYQ
jgi:hypothetical protein